MAGKTKDVSEMALSIARIIDRLAVGEHILIITKSKNPNVDVDVRLLVVLENQHIVYRPWGAEDVEALDKK